MTERPVEPEIAAGAGPATPPSTGTARDVGGATDIDPPRPFPTTAVSISFAVILAAQVAAAYVLSRVNDWSSATRAGIIVGGVISVAGCSIAILVLRPWRPRPASVWAVHWIGATTVRFLFTPAALFSVYFATFLPGPAVFLGGVAAYLAALAAESVIIARAMLAPAPTYPKRGDHNVPTERGSRRDPDAPTSS